MVEDVPLSYDVFVPLLFTCPLLWKSWGRGGGEYCVAQYLFECAMEASHSIPERDLEKSPPNQIEEDDPDLDYVGGLEGYVLDAQAGNASRRHLKTTNDVSTILIPQPSVDPNDPLNWSQTKKNIILIVISFTGNYPACSGPRKRRC